MKVGSSSARYVSGSLYQRQKTSGAYTPGSKFKRFGNFGLMQHRNLSSMNRGAIDGYRAAVAAGGSIMFEAKFAQSEGMSEMAVQQVMQRVKEAAAALADRAEGLSLANGGTGGATAETDGTDEKDGDKSDGTGKNVDETA
jgi:hypothetical protein